LLRTFPQGVKRGLQAFPRPLCYGPLSYFRSERCIGGKPLAVRCWSFFLPRHSVTTSTRLKR